MITVQFDLQYFSIFRMRITPQKLTELESIDYLHNTF